MKKVFVTFLLLLSLGSAVCAYYAWEFYVRPASSQNKELIVDVAPGSTLYSVIQKLQAEGIVIPATQLRIWNAITNAGKRLQIGEYAVQSHQSAHKILTSLIEGRPLGHRITVREGLHIWDVMQSFKSASLDIRDEAFMAWVTDSRRLNRMEVPQPTDPRVKRTLEGFLFPETYVHYKYQSPETIIDHMLDLYEKQIKPLLSQHPWGNTPEGRYRLLTLASIVEKESGDVAEQPLVASVYWNRIHKRMRLQADPTIIYGLMPNFNGNITRANIREATAYNTYVITGLPPTPIASPGVSAIKAVLNPAKSDYLFFVSRNDGTHVFSKDYATHNKYVDEFQRSKRTRRTEVNKNSR